MEDTASTHIMAADETGTWDNLTVSVNYPSDAMLAFMLPASTTYQMRPSDENYDEDYDVTDFWPQLNDEIAKMIFDLVKKDSALTRKGKGVVTPPQSPRQTEARRAPPAPIRPPRPAVAQDPGQPLAAARALFAGVPAGAPDA